VWLGGEVHLVARLGHRLGRRCLGAVNFALRHATQAAGLTSVASHHVYAPALGPGAFSIDAGANVGDFAHGILAAFGGRVLALEPAPELLARVSGHAQQSDIRPVAGALAGTDGIAVIHLSNNPEANSLDRRVASQFGYRGEIRVRTWSLTSLLAEAGVETADLLKLDIEGAELAVLEQAPPATLQAFAQITVEFHDFLGDRSSTDRIRAIRERMADLGFRDIVLSSPWGHHADVLFLNRSRIRLLPINLMSFLFLKHIALPLRGLIHRWRKGPA
jgi:FkbM family methyltransferase